MGGNISQCDLCSSINKFKNQLFFSFCLLWSVHTYTCGQINGKNPCIPKLKLRTENFKIHIISKQISQRVLAAITPTPASGATERTVIFILCIYTHTYNKHYVCTVLLVDQEIINHPSAHIFIPYKTWKHCELSVYLTRVVVLPLSFIRSSLSLSTDFHGQSIPGSTDAKGARW